MNRIEADVSEVPGGKRLGEPEKKRSRMEGDADREARYNEKKEFRELG